VAKEAATARDYMRTLDGRYPRVDAGEMFLFDRQHGYDPKMTEAFSQKVLESSQGMTKDQFTNELYRETYEAYQKGQINIPGYRMYYVDQNPTAINAFVDKNDDLLRGLNEQQLRGLGFTGGSLDVQPGDKIKIGEVVKLVLENAAKRINA
jgi:hypothetical protein